MNEAPFEVAELAIDTRAVKDMVIGLSQSPMTLPSKYFYDRTGSELFERICGTPEYYLTRIETGILAEYAGEIAGMLGPRVRLVELGSGSSQKTRILLDNLEEPVAYVPVDVSEGFVNESARRLAREYPGVEIKPVFADFTEPFSLPPDERARRTVVFFPGSSIGNFSPAEIVTFLSTVRTITGPDGRLLVGIDLVKDVEQIESAYNDAEGVTAAFNLNILSHLNDIAGSDFDVTKFEHHAAYNDDLQRVEMCLVANTDTDVRVGGRCFDLPRGTSIRTELSHKFTVSGFSSIASRAGLGASRVWSDKRHWFSILLIERERSA